MPEPAVTDLDYQYEGTMPDQRALSWHDVTCPEGPDCRDRELHAIGVPIVTTGILDRYHKRLEELQE